MLTAGDRKSRKSMGVHYTPENLANFLAKRLLVNASSDFVDGATPLKVLDPACGDGALLSAFAKQIPDQPVTIVGYETDLNAVKAAKANLSSFENCQVLIQHNDFLDCTLNRPRAEFDIVITNPPYVRTQVLGKQQAQNLATQFGLKGRIDLYQAFLCAISKMLRDNGWIGALTSNRFLYTQAGKSTRALLYQHYRIAELYDLGDTRLFEAAVLPAIFIARKSQSSANDVGAVEAETNQDLPKFVRIEQANCDSKSGQAAGFFEAIENAPEGVETSFEHQQTVYQIESGRLKHDETGQVWRLEHTTSRHWLNQVALHQQSTIGDIAEVKVGIKTTADSVFIRKDWQDLQADLRPENELLRPLVTHHVGRRWKGLPVTTQVLYPYRNQSTRAPVQLDDYPRSKDYLNQYEQRLSGRKYLIEAGREWFEIWVPHRATDWSSEKIVWPDISEEPRFFLDFSGSVVNGDCYWIKLKEGQSVDWLYLILGVANSRVALQFYDYRFHNKLYGRRRRFMTQYVKQFPLPDIESSISQQIIQTVKQIVISKSDDERNRLEPRIEELVHQAFGVGDVASDSTESTRCP